MKLKDFIARPGTLLMATLLLGGCSTTGNADPMALNSEGRSDQIMIDLTDSDFSPMRFVSRYYGDDDWQATLSMNVTYEPIISLRKKIADHLGYGSLKYLTAWEPEGEAHVTTITPVEYQECMWSEEREIEVLRMDAIEAIARKYSIQKSDLKILGIGSGAKKFDDRVQTDETFFVIVTSQNLLKIRNAVYRAYIRNGGAPSCWSPDKFYPHITIGFTHEDIHYPDVKKNVEGSLDGRFPLKATSSASLQCKSIAVDAAIEAVNLVNNDDFYQRGYIDHFQSQNSEEKFRVVLNDHTDHPDGQHAFQITLNANDNCNLISLTDDYSGNALPNPYE